MSAPSSLQRRNRATVLGKTYRDLPYKPQFGLGIVCRDEADQRRIYARLLKLFPGRDVRVLVI